MHARDEQMEREKYFELILDSVDTGIIVVEEGRGVVLRYNRAAQKLLQREVITHVDQIKETMKNFSSRETNTFLKGRRVRIVAFSDIKGELANQEIDSWVKLIRVLTHEIMNTVTPIVSLSDTLLRHSEGEQHEDFRLSTAQARNWSSLLRTTADSPMFLRRSLRSFTLSRFLSGWRVLPDSILKTDALLSRRASGRSYCICR